MSQPFNDIQQIEMAIKAAQKMVGAATMSMDPDQLQTATQALEDAKRQLQSAKQHDLDSEFIDYSSTLIEKLEHQVDEAKH
ncbi:DUF2564 family protein [Bacillus shivajii]|uniref:DUF2564 family protein n=1 Tax=Bacillus shivajii TaxID=1983719 RepID=UPI001CFBEBFE|nr:DUF2564 family protein [Bacillus shivajii]UCZ51495.1 DUF2564 family protein [Bacillus shivajii]